MLIKMGTAVLMVVVLSLLAEAVSPGFAGIISGFPLGAAVSLFFIGLEVGPGFAAQCALYTALGLIASLVFAYGYYRCSLLVGSLSRGSAVLSASTAGIAAYFLAAWGLHFLEASPVLSLLLPTGAICLFHQLLRHVEGRKIEQKVRWTVRVILLRAFFAACVVVLVTSTARIVGPGWAGLFAAFPMTVLPLLAILHYTYGASSVHGVLRSFPVGLGALVVYTLGVSICYPLYGIYLGTLAAYGFATLYLVLIQVSTRRGTPKRVLGN